MGDVSSLLSGCRAASNTLTHFPISTNALVSHCHPCRYDIEHEAYSVFRPNPVQVKAAKYTNFAGLIGYKPLASSTWVAMVWRSWTHQCFFWLQFWQRLAYCFFSNPARTAPFCQREDHRTGETLVDSFVMEANMVYQIV